MHKRAQKQVVDLEIEVNFEMEFSIQVTWKFWLKNPIKDNFDSLDISLYPNCGQPEIKKDQSTL